MDEVYADGSSRGGGSVADLRAVATLALIAAPVESQRLLTLVPRATQPVAVAAQDFGPVVPIAVQVDLPARAEAAQNHEQLDILVVSTGTAALNWSNQEGVQASIRSAGDYLNMVLRNGDLSDVEYMITVTGTVAGGTATYRNEPGSLRGEIDIEAF